MPAAGSPCHRRALVPFDGRRGAASIEKSADLWEPTGVLDIGWKMRHAARARPRYLVSDKPPAFVTLPPVTFLRGILRCPGRGWRRRP
jgi:hypothetical protein